MHPIKTNEANFCFLGPNAEIADAPCRREGNDTFLVFELTQADRDVIAAGGHVRLGIIGMPRMPPVSMQCVPNMGPWELVPAPCDECGKENADPIHLSGPGTHAFRLRKSQ